MKRLAAFFCSIFILGFASQALAGYYISWGYVQHRVHEDGRDFNRLAFQIVDDTTGNAVTQDLATSVRLFKQGIEVELSDGKFDPHDIGFNTHYNTDSSQWFYDSTIEDASYYTYNIDTDELRLGTYRLVVIYDGVRLVSFLAFNGLVDLPVIKEARIKTSIDSKGNLYCSWILPNKLYWMTDVDSPPNMSARVDLNVYLNGEYIGYVSTKLPAHMDRVFYPARILEQIKAIGGDSYKFSVMLRSNDNNNRTYSNPVDINF